MASTEEDKMDIDGEQEQEQEQQPLGRVEQARLDAYYQYDFPVDLMERWLGYGNSSIFKRREFVFQRTAADGDTMMARYKSFDNAAGLRNGLLNFRPDRVEIGPVYTHQPKLKDKAIGVFEATQRELIFDIDASDYDDIRVCCKDKKMCDQCWEFMISGVRILNRLLTETFGYKHLLWVFSGRRGIHCWVSDEKARMLTNDQRAAIARYIQVHVGGKTLEEAKLTIERDLQQGWLHPTLEHIYKQVETAFSNIVLNLDNVNNLSNRKVSDDIMSCIQTRLTPSQSGNSLSKISGILDKCVDGQYTPQHAWSLITKIQGPEKRPITWVFKVIEFMYAYPRLDTMVSTKRNHLLKSPYSVHPGTGLICVPFVVSELDDFKPFRDAPHVARLQTKELPRLSLFEDYVSKLEGTMDLDETVTERDILG
eukprot:TRINITY_DN7622_c2_g1_i2.p1 TRINITY_DN7622_c2_g1~~TRINITY_DN7622_c2_g1_i2.p1  ORF type:complete len:441 (+),score=82.79 TRINITY_DN7622_c2_g1_i2:54-1325(+)